MSEFISVIIPVHNRPEKVAHAINAVLAQTYQDFELIVVDDGSTDQTFATLQQIRVRHPHIKLLQQKNRGVAAARNAGVKISKGEWLAFLDSDDSWEPSKLQAQIDFLKKHPKFQVVQTRERWIRNGERVNPHQKHQMQSGHIFEPSLELCLISPSAVLIAKNLFEDLGGFDESFPACEDYELWLRLTAQHPVGLIDEAFTIHTGGHADQLSRKYWGMDRFRIRAIQKLLDSYILLTPQQTQAALKVYLKKHRVLRQGALKRKRLFYWLYLKYQQFRIVKTYGDSN
jgi:glycosyltransferase involved in cell wall biosynthesis